MQTKDCSTDVVTFKLAAALEKYEMDLRALADSWLDLDKFRRLQQEFCQLGKLGASLPRLSVAWMAVLLSRYRLLRSLCSLGAPVVPALREHLAAVEGLRRNCLRCMGAHGVALA